MLLRLDENAAAQHVAGLQRVRAKARWQFDSWLVALNLRCEVVLRHVAAVRGDSSSATCSLSICFYLLSFWAIYFHVLTRCT